MKVITKPSFKEEQILWNSNVEYVIGIDEVGRGAFAGPIVAAGVVFDPTVNINLLAKVNDSKLVKPKLREELSEIIKSNSIWAIESVEIDYINKYGIGMANKDVFHKVIRKLLAKLKTESYFLLIDGFDLKIPKQKGIIKGDQKSLSIAAASILAKVYRDDLMRKAHEAYPNYLFAKNKGYGTLEHREAIKANGLCDLHRTSFIDFLFK